MSRFRRRLLEGVELASTLYHLRIDQHEGFE